MRLPAASLGLALLLIAVTAAPDSTLGKAADVTLRIGTVLAAYKPGQTVTLKVTHQNGTTGQIKVTLGQYPGT